MNHYFIEDIHYSFVPFENGKELNYFVRKYEHTIIDNTTLSKIFSEIKEKVEQLNSANQYGFKIHLIHQWGINSISAYYGSGHNGYIFSLFYTKVKSYNISSKKENI